MPTAPRDGATSSAAGVSITFAAPGASEAAAPAPAAEADAEFAELGRAAAASSASRAGGAQQLMAEMAAVLEAPSGTVLEPELQSMAEPRDSDSDEFDADPQSPRSDPADFLRERLAGARALRPLLLSRLVLPLSRRCHVLPSWGSISLSAQCDCAPSVPVRRRAPFSRTRALG